jgi:hypothetical protein
MVALRRTSAYGLHVNVADAADVIVEEEASHADCEPNTPRRQTSDLDSAAVRPRRRGRRFLAFCRTQHGGISRRAARAAGAAERECAELVERDGGRWLSCTRARPHWLLRLLQAAARHKGPTDTATQRRTRVPTHRHTHKLRHAHTRTLTHTHTQTQRHARMHTRRKTREHRRVCGVRGPRTRHKG